MIEVYWIAGVRNLDDPGGLESWLANAGLKINWIDEIFWLSDSNAPIVPSLPNRASYWSLTGTPSHRLLHLIMSELLLAKNDLVLLVEQPGENFSLAVLGTPRAVGRFNLLPEIRLCAMDQWSVSLALPEIQKKLKSQLAEIDLELSSIGILAHRVDQNIDLNLDLPGVRKIELRPGCGLIDSLVSIITAMKNQSVKTGLFIDGNATILEVV